MQNKYVDLAALALARSGERYHVVLERSRINAKDKPLNHLIEGLLNPEGRSLEKREDQRQQLGCIALPFTRPINRGRRRDAKNV
jgi:hypothetical protein